ncbi:hypothetical protein GWI33_019892 [Rhynchophorus ferrugineus]|uniref:Uncharacterized protein n=1 Tax=Rhynchophorus ferrugineus TaxID=354439 RepID=A0A834M0Z1_RHYFE|nr:hypothetical protein GWI33_019892 [Rhynchophorus ferrugineus]
MNVPTERGLKFHPSSVDGFPNTRAIQTADLCGLSGAILTANKMTESQEAYPIQADILQSDWLIKNGKTATFSQFFLIFFSAPALHSVSEIF